MSTINKIFSQRKYALLLCVTCMVALLSFAMGCSPRPNSYLEAGEELAGGQTTIFDVSVNAFGQPAPGLEREQELLFFVGNSYFNQNWVSAPASTTARDGLGPYFNARSCASCHFKDGRGRPPEFDGEQPTGFLVRLTSSEETAYGNQLQDGAIFDLTPQGTVIVRYEEVPVTLGDGTVVSLRRPIYQIDAPGYGDLPDDILLSPRVGNQMIGLGLLEAIPEETILTWADADDADEDGISGRPNFVYDKVNNTISLGRFGWKSNQPSLLQQSADAFHGDIGITTWINPDNTCIDEECAALPDGGSPEIDNDDLDKLVLYVSSLAVPARRDGEDETVLRGKELFNQANCSGCHQPSTQTGQHPTIPALSNQTIYPYTDLLLHDMGEGLADNRPDFEATGQEWRTPPLWGIGLIETVNKHTYFLHDGRARNLLEAILWHGGEAETAVDFFKSLPEEDRNAIITFLESL